MSFTSAGCPLLADPTDTLLHFVFKDAQPARSTLAFLVVLLMAEYGLYTWAASPSDPVNGLYNALVTLIFLVLFFRPTFTHFAPMMTFKDCSLAGRRAMFDVGRQHRHNTRS